MLISYALGCYGVCGQCIYKLVRETGPSRLRDLEHYPELPVAFH